jgi:hypothetical protein
MQHTMLVALAVDRQLSPVVYGCETEFPYKACLPQGSPQASGSSSMTEGDGFEAAAAAGVAGGDAVVAADVQLMC